MSVPTGAVVQERMVGAAVVAATNDGIGARERNTYLAGFYEGALWGLRFAAECKVAHDAETSAERASAGQTAESPMVEQQAGEITPADSSPLALQGSEKL